MKPRPKLSVHYKWRGRATGKWTSVAPRSIHNYAAYVNPCITICGRGGHYRTPKAETGTENMRRVTTRLELVTCQECWWAVRQFIAARYTLTPDDERGVREIVKGRLTRAGLEELVGV